MIGTRWGPIKCDGDDDNDDDDDDDNNDDDDDDVFFQNKIIGVKWLKLY